MAHQHGIVSQVKVTTLPVTPGLKISIIRHDDDSILLEGVTDVAGNWKIDHTIDKNTIVILVLENEEREVIRCRVPIYAINPMDCMLVEKKARTQDEMHKAWRKAYRDQQKSGVAKPDPDDVAKQAFQY